jgi:hypothetical protein
VACPWLLAFVQTHPVVWEKEGDEMSDVSLRQKPVVLVLAALLSTFIMIAAAVVFPRSPCPSPRAER